MTTARTCDPLGASQHRAQPCNGCMPAPRRSHRICSADQCQQGRAPCPCPAACEVPEHAARQQQDEADARREIIITAVAALAAAGLVVFLVKTAIFAW